MKKKVLGGIQGMLDERLAGRLKPKAPAAHGMPPPEGGGDDGQVEPGEGTPMEEQQDGTELQSKLPEGADVSNLSPEEKLQLEELYAKMGC